jgi:hypothetical protein
MLLLSFLDPPVRLLGFAENVADVDPAPVFGPLVLAVVVAWPVVPADACVLYDPEEKLATEIPPPV